MTGTIKMSGSRFALAGFLLLALLAGSAFAAPGAPPEQGLHAGSVDQKLTKVSPDLLVLYQAYQAYLSQGLGAALKPGNSALPVSGNQVVVDAVASGDTSALLSALEALGLQHGAAYGRMVSGLLPIDAIDDLDSLDSLNFVWPAYTTTSVGLVDSQGDEAMKADDARATWGVDGTGVIVGTLSDSYDCAPTPTTDAAKDVANGDLLAGIVVLDDTGCSVSNSDEGRAMMQIIADVAPGAGQAFHTAEFGMAAFAQGIEDLAADAKADIIVDDVGYFAEPFFQDGIVAQAVDKVVGKGVVYLSAAGNKGRDSYEDQFRSTGGSPFDPHDFDPDSGVDPCQSVTIPVSAAVKLSFQWDQPFFAVSGPPGSASDLDIALYDDSCTTVLKASAVDSVGSDPLEILVYTNPGPATAFNIVIRKSVAAGGPNPAVIKYVDYGGAMTVNEYETISSTIVGHANADGAAAVGAAPYSLTPEFGTDPAVLEPFSSTGGTLIRFATDGTLLPVPENRGKPHVVAPDAVNTTFFKAGVDPDNDGFPNFGGTSAAAPHAAGVAALLLEERPSLTPDQLLWALASTARDMDGPFKPGFPDGFDHDSGWGLVDAGAALAWLNAGPGEASAFLPIVSNSYDPNQLLGNGNFDSGAWTPWQSAGLPQLDDQTYRSASYSARLAGRDNVDSDYVVQEVTVAADTTEATVDFWYQVSGTDSSSPPDYLCVEILDSEATTVLVPVVCFDLYNQPQDQWLNFHDKFTSAELAPILGQTVLVSFQGWTNATNPSTVWVDDVSFKVTR